MPSHMGLPYNLMRPPNHRVALDAGSPLCYILDVIGPAPVKPNVAMNSVTYSVKCPKCSAEAAARMRATGEREGYREPKIKLEAGRILCGTCGFCHEVPAEESAMYELWYVTTFRGHRLWARNRRHLAFLISWFTGAVSKAALGIGDRDMVESFPKWMISAKNRAGLLRSLNRLAGINANALQRTRPSRTGCNPRVPRAASLSLGRSP